MKETSDTLRGPKVNARKPLLIGTRSQILDEYDRRNKSL